MKLIVHMTIYLLKSTLLPATKLSLSQSLNQPCEDEFTKEMILEASFQMTLETHFVILRCITSTAAIRIKDGSTLR